ncbi:unnamed protein product [Ceratitis capitata]|uniref:(Mediterranean fruit fly) hypothetical protein n=2 Tax=Ceratitis capitata TaxID=7213 RepID=A0A811VK80_CERCA|nr:unnamed protein product [Ceratitis capitata]
MEKEGSKVVVNEREVGAYIKEESKINIQLSKPTLKSSKLSGSLQDDKFTLEPQRIPMVLEVTDEELLSSESESTISMEAHVRSSSTSSTSEDFFEKLGTIPNIGSFIKRTQGKDIGSFVDPLTGLLVSSTEEEEEEEEEMVEEEESSTTEESSFSEDEELLELLKREKEVEAPKILDDTEVFETFMEMEKAHVVEEVVEFDWVAYEREKETKHIAADTIVFLNELLTEVVEKCEYIDPNLFLRQNLDKPTLMEEIGAKLRQLEIEQKTRSFLNRRVAEFFYRKGQYRVFMDDPPGTILDEISKFKDATMKLDQMLSREAEVKGTSQGQISNIQLEVAKLEISNQEKLLELEQLIKKSFAYKGEHFNTDVDVQLRTMAKLRDEISDVRYVLIQKQHSNAKLAEQLKEMENLGNNLQMREYESLQNEVQALDKKIEERNTDLVRSRVRCNADLHILGHLKEKQAMIRSKIKIQKSCLATLLQQKFAARKWIFDSKQQRTRMRKEIKELSYQCGLLDKPALMLDYDKTAQQVNAVADKVEKLRYKHDEILKK